MRLLRSQDAQYEVHFLVHDSAWSKNLTVEVDGHGVVSQTGSVADAVSDPTACPPPDPGNPARSPPTRGTLPARGTGATDATVGHPATTTPQDGDQQRR